MTEMNNFKILGLANAQTQRHIHEQSQIYRETSLPLTVLSFRNSNRNTSLSESFSLEILARKINIEFTKSKFMRENGMV